MAGVSADFSIKYPQTTYAVRELRHLETEKPHVFKAFMEDTGIGRDRASDILTLQTTMAKSEPIPYFYLPEIPMVGKYASYPGVGDGIKLGLRFVKQFDKLAGWYGPFDGEVVETELRRVRGNTRLLMESKLMHELVHWGRARVTGLPAGVRRENKRNPELKELGWKFEEKAYSQCANAGLYFAVQPPFRHMLFADGLRGTRQMVGQCRLSADGFMGTVGIS